MKRAADRGSGSGAEYWFSGRKACVVGLGKSGLAAARLLKRCGADVWVTEKRPASAVAEWAGKLPPGTVCETGGHKLLARPWDLVVASPGVPRDLWRPLAERGAPVWGELELGYRFLSLTGRLPRRVAAVTGTNGKTTTAALLGEMFRAAGARTVVAGNIGTPLCDEAERLDPETALVLEVSSYQLEACAAFRPDSGAVLNVTPDHLGRHGTMENYARQKFRLFENQSRDHAAVLNRRDAWCRRLAKTAPGRVLWFGPGGDFFEKNGRLAGALDGRRFSWPLPRYLAGGHNAENALAAAACAVSLGAGAGAVGRALAAFRGVEHRLETARERRGVRFINDSKATNVDSTVMALRAVEGPLHLILGGEDKGSPYAPLKPLLRAKARSVLLIGEAAEKIARELAGAAPLISCGTLARAVQAAAERARPGEAVLLSPACASFDQFENFEHRGRTFKELVDAL
ncbi:MAG: UDP-N-acetylmuramoyl-L-alanine--D-glutamate ligase [Elusimicrobiota bacterium]